MKPGYELFIKSCPYCKRKPSFRKERTYAWIQCYFRSCNVNPKVYKSGQSSMKRCVQIWNSVQPTPVEEVVNG